MKKISKQDPNRSCVLRGIMYTLAVAVWMGYIYFHYTSTAQVYLDTTGAELAFWQWAILPEFGMAGVR